MYHCYCFYITTDNRPFLDAFKMSLNGLTRRNSKFKKISIRIMQERPVAPALVDIYTVLLKGIITTNYYIKVQYFALSYGCFPQDSL